MSATSLAYVNSAVNYRIIAHRALRGGDKDKFYSAMRFARSCIYYARRS